MVTPSVVTSTPATKTPEAPGAPGTDLPRIVPRRHARRWPTGAVMVLGFLLGTVLAHPGQTEAAQALGVSRRRTLRGTSIVSVLAVHDLLYSVQLIYNQTYQVIPLLMVATLWYIAVTTVLSAGQFHVEWYYARGNSRALPPTPLQRLRGHLTAVRHRLSAATAADARPAIGGDR